jgi:hypothetical protein
MRLPLWGLVLLLLGCRTSIVASDYSQVCSVDEDCVAVASERTLCGWCLSTCVDRLAAINRAELERYGRDRETIRKNCPPNVGPPPPCANPSSLMCPTGSAAAVCSLGRCSVR